MLELGDMIWRRRYSIVFEIYVHSPYICNIYLMTLPQEMMGGTALVVFSVAGGQVTLGLGFDLQRPICSVSIACRVLDNVKPGLINHRLLTFGGYFPNSHFI